MSLVAGFVVIAALDFYFWFSLRLRTIMERETLLSMSYVVSRVEILDWRCWSFSLDNVLNLVYLRGVYCLAIENCVLACMRNMIHF